MKIEKILQKKNREKIICLTAYSFPVAKILDEICDVILVGDSLGMTIYGMKDTVDVTLEMMINHGLAVVRAAKKSLIVVDMPHGSYEKSDEWALENARRIVEETSCDAIKIEVTPQLVSRAEFLVKNNINVMGHVGLLPQHVREIGGYKYQGKDEKSAAEILQTAKDIEKAGAFSLVIEAVPESLAAKISAEIKIPTIGIGASSACDGQVLVIDDLLGLNQEFTPKFVKKYENLAERISAAANAFSKDVKEKKFPGKENVV